MSKVDRRDSYAKNLSARRSQRRINKLLEKNISQYQIPNPYRSYRAHPCLPPNLSRQLSKLDFLSVRSLQNLHFKEPSAYQEINQLLLKMRFAVQRQSEQFQAYVSQMTEKMKKFSQKTNYEQAQKNGNEEEADELNHSAYMPKDSQNSMELQINEGEDSNLRLVSQPSEGASMMSDNYESDKLVFHSDRNFGVAHHVFLGEDMLESYQL